MYALMGLYKGTVQNIVTGSYMLPSANDKRKIRVFKRESTRKNKERRSYLSGSTALPRFGLGGLSHIRKKEEKNYQKGEIHRQLLKDRIYGTDTTILLSLYPTEFGYSLGGYSHRERCRAPDRKKSIERSRGEADK
jgi:hypothetical protein